MHLSRSMKEKWTIIDPISIDKENKIIKVALEDHCYFSIISDEVKTAV